MKNFGSNQNPHVEALNPVPMNVTMFGDKVLEEAIRLKQRTSSPGLALGLYKLPKPFVCLFVCFYTHGYRTR